MFDFKKLVSLSLLFSVTLNPSQAEAGKRKSPEEVEERCIGNFSPALLDYHLFDSIENGDESSTKTKKRRGLPSQDEESSQYTGVQIIKGYDGHRDLLVDMLNSAQQEILISSKSIAYQPPEIYDAFQEAVTRGVEIRVYADSGEKSFQNQSFCDFLQEKECYLQFLNIHAKFFIVDGKSPNGLAVIGSHNWLSESENSEGANGDSSFLISDPNAVERLRGKTFQTAIKYTDLLRTLLKPNAPNYMQKVTSIREDIKRINPVEFSIGEMTFKYLTTLRHHEGALKHYATEAKKQMVIYSPFFHKASAKKRLEEVFSTLKPTVRLTLSVQEKDKKSLLDLLIENRWLPRVNIKVKEDFHGKTLKIDRRIRVEGSFNWLSASTDDNSDHHNMETSLVRISNEDENQ